MASQSFSFDWLKEKTANLNIEIDSIELLKSCILIVGGRGLDDKKKKILVVDAVTGTVLAEFTEKQSKDAKVLRLQYLAHSEKLVYSSGTELRVLSPTVNGSYLIDAALNQHIPTSASEPVTIELPLQDAQQIVKVLKAQLNKDESEINKLGISLPELKAVVAQIEDRTTSILKATSNKQLQFPTVTFTAVYSKVKAMLGALTSQLNESEVLSAANAVNETVKLSGKSFETAALAKSTTAVTDEMNAELNRLKSFTFWPRTNKHATPSNLAKAGFYHQPKVEANAQLAGQDRCVCFSCKLVVSDWTNKDHPWREHCTLKPTCAFVQGKTTNNVPLAVSLAALPAERTDVDIKSISSAPHTELILTTSDEPHNPIVTVWDTTAGLRKLYSFAARDGKLHTKKENKPTNDVFSGEKNPERDGTLTGVYLMQCKPRPVTVKPAEEKKGKWVEWCTTDIEVFVGDKGLYPGAKGLVFDLIDKETICVFLPVIGEVVNLPLSHLLPFKPKANQKVRILKGDLQGEEGVLVALQEQTGVVRLLSTKKIVTVDLNSLASMPSPEGSIEKEAEDQDIEDCCAVCLFTLDNSAAFVVYELSNKEPKFMQTYHIEGKGSATQAIYSATQQRVVVAFKHDSQILLSSFTFDEEHRRLSEHKSQVLAHDVSDPIVKLMSIELNNSEALLLVTELGRFYCLDRETLQLIASLAQPTDSLLLRDATFVTGDNQVVAADRQGRLLNLEVKSTNQQAVEPQQDNSALLKIDLGPVTEENLKSLNKFQFDSIEFSSFPPPGVKQVRLQDGTRVKWRIPSDSERSEHLFEIEFTKTRTVDSLELEMGLSRAWLGIENEILGPKYMLSLSYQDYTNNKWIKTLDKFDLTGLISFGDSDEPSGKLRIGSINVHFTARRLLLTLVSASRDEQNNKLSRRKMDFSKDNIKKVMSKKFDYQTDFDENGLLYWIGSNGHKEEWKNPLTSGKIKLEISHEKMYSQEMKKEDIIGRAVTQSTYWGGNCPQWFYVDLGSEYRLMCDHYTLRHGYQHANSYIQNWLFQGSNDAENWVTLHEGGETPFTKGFDTKTFHIKDGKEHFRYFRVLQKGNYSMGVGKPGGSAYICVAGFEIYGELYSGASSKPSPNSVNSLAVKFASLKPIEGKSLSEIRALRHSLFESTPFYLSLIKACEDMKTSVGLRHQCLDLLLDVWKRASDKMLSILEAINLEVFIRINIVGADKATALKAGRVLMYAVHVGQEMYKKSLLIASLDVLTHAFDHCRTPGGMNQLFAMLYLCWDADRVKAHARAVKILLNLGHKLFEARSPFYNLLRTHFGLYGYPLELDLFETPSRSDKQKKTEEPLGKSAEALEQQLHIYSLEFASKRRNLTTMLEEINISGDLFASHEKDVNKAYTDCISAQIMFHRVRKHLQALKPNEHIVSSADNRLDRWTSAAERLFQCLNQQNDEFEHEEAMLQDLFTHYCVYGTPTLRREAARFLMHQLGSQVSFPSNTLRKFFCSNPEYTRPINLFPQQEVFDTLQEIMGQDRLRFFYVDDLFSMLEELTAATNVSNIDVALVSWVLLLLSNTMSLTPDKAPVHQGSKCRNCNMSPICGVRYRCVNCLDYDLCEQCESDSTAHNKSHLFLKIPTALPLPPSSFRGMPPPKDPLLPLMYAQDSSSVSPASLDEQDGYTHTGVSCDGCGKTPIKGIRYKCVHCDEFNFCETCEGKVEHYPLHLFLKIRRPVPSGATTENPKALIPVLLHRGFYPFSQFKSQSSQSFTKLSKSVTDASKMKKDSDQLSPNSLSVSSGKSLRSSAADITKFINESSDVTQAAGSVFDGRHLRSIFSVISLSARMQPLSPELFLLAMRVLEGLTNQYTPDDIYEDVFKHPKFDEFLRQVSSYPSTFIRSAVLQMVEKLCNIETYSGGKESAQAIRRIRALLRSKAIKLLLSNDNKNFSADFLLELLLVITYEQELGTKSSTEASPSTSSSAASSSQSAATTTDEAESASPVTVRKTARTEDESEDYALDEIAAYLLHYLSRDNPLTASAAARPWCMVLRLLHSVDPKQLCRLPALLNVFREAILAPEELQVLLLDDFVQLASKLLATEGLGEVLQRELMGELVVTFPQVHYDTHTLLYLRLLEVMREHFTAAVHYKIEHLFALLQELAAELPDSLALAVHGASSKGNRLLQVVLDVLNTVFTAPTFTAADRAHLLDLANKQKRDKAFTTLFIQWLSSMEQSDKSATQPTLTASSSTAVLNTSSNALTSSSSSTLTASNAPVTASVSSSALPTATKFDLSKSIVRLIKILSTENEGAKHFLELCLSVLRTKPTSVSIAELCLTLVRNEELAHYLIVELEGYKFLFDQIKSSNSRARSSFLAPAFANILSHSKKNNAANVTRPVKSGDKLENLSHVSELLEPKQDKLLARLLKESVIVSSCIWTYNFKRSKEVDEDKFSMTIAIPDNVILREIRIDCINNYNSTSRFPPFITVETGTSLARLLPVGRFPCKPSALQPNPNTKYTSTFKLPLPGIEVVKFIRMHLQCPNKSAWIALSRIQLLGHSSLLYNAKEEGEDPLLTAQLPLSASLELLEHCVRHDLVQQFLAQQKETQTFALFLLQILTTKTSQAVQNILSHLAKYDVELSDKLLQQLLTGQTTCHAALAGRLCGLGDADTVNRLNRLRDFVFRELANHTATSLSSHLMPFLNALSDAISSYQRKGLAVQCVVTAAQIELLFNCAINSLEGSLMQQGSLRLLSSLIQSTPDYFQVLLNKFNASMNETAVVKAVVPQSSNRPDQNAFRTLGILASSSSLCATRLLDTGIPSRIVTVINEYAQHVDKSASVEEAQKFLEAALAFFADISHNETVKHWLGKHAFDVMFELCSRKDFGSKVHYAIQDVFRVCANLNEQNQEMIAAYLLTQLTQPNSAQMISEFMLQLMVDMFSLEDRVVICLHSLTGSSEELNLLDTSTTARTDPIRLDRKLCHPHLDLDEDQLGATANTLATTGWRTVLSEKPITSGMRRWEVILEKCTSTANIMIGVCERHQKLNAYIGQNNTAKGWSYYGATTGYTYHDGKSNSQYGQKMKEGDVIGVTLDMDEGTLAFTRNGEDLGVAFSTGLAGFELYPAVSLYDVGDRVRFREIEGPTAKQGVLWATKLNSSNPLTYQRSAPLFNVPATTTLAQLAESLTAMDPEGVVALFQLPGQPDTVLQSQLTMLELHRLVGSGSELVDLNIEIIKRDDERSVRAIKPTASGISEQVGSVLKRFADKGGLAQLVDMIDTHLQKKESTSTPSDSKTKTKETDIATWRTWLQLLRKELQVTGFVQMFVRDSDCRALLFRVMTEAQDVKTGPVRDISERLGLAAVPTPSEALLANPMQPLLSALFDLLRTSQHSVAEDSLQVRSEVMQAGVLAALLSLLTDLCDTAPRDPEHPAFSAAVDKWRSRQKDRQDKAAKAQNGSDGKFWAKGTGYGTNADDTAPVTWSHEAYVKEQTALAKKIATLLEGVQGFLAVTAEPLDHTQPALSTEAYQLIAASSLVPVLGSYLRNDSLLDMGRHFDLYTAVLKTTRALALHDALVNLADELPNQSVSLFDLLHKLHTMADVILKRLPKSRLENAAPQKKEQSSEEDEITLAIEISKTQSLVRQRVLDHRAKTVVHKQPLQPAPSSNQPLDSAKEKELEFSRLYQEQLAELQFDEILMKDDSGDYKHHYKSRIKSDTSSAPKKMKRLVQEVGSLSTGLPLFPDSSVFLRVDSDRMDVLKCVITGPKDTPYMNGFFEFDVYCPPEYPAVPPVINLQTTGNGTVRFNPNLYNCGKVCLSLLGTWRGGPNEKWNESTSTLLQVFVSIQSLILVDKPYFNEPGYESSMNTPKGEQQSRQYNEVIRLATIRWAMLEQIRNPPLGFEEVAKTHFKLKRTEIMQQCQQWIKEAKESKSPGHLDKLQKLVDELKKELQALDPNTPLELTSSDAPVTPDEKKVDEKEVKRWESALSLQDVVPGFPLALYVKALSLNQDKADLAVNWLLEKGENYLLDHAELFKAEAPKGLNEKKS